MMAPSSTSESVDQVRRRICAEYLEMPGLRVDARQAQRLWGIDQRTCHAVMQYLVDTKFLHRTEQGVYRLASEGIGARSAAR